MRRLILGVIGVVVLLLVVIFGYRYYYTGQHYVSTDNALISGDLIQVGASNAGRVAIVRADVGDVVQKGQVLATVNVPTASTLGLTASTGPVQGTQVASDLISPVDGVVVAKPASAGDQVSPGQPVLTLVDLTSLWVTANVDEGKISRISVGQAVDVHVDTLDKTLPGKVVAITPASAGTFSLLPQNNASGNYTKVTQRVPVKIAVDYGGTVLFPGTSVEVTVRVA